MKLSHPPLTAEELKHRALLEEFEVSKKEIAAYRLKWITDLKRRDYMVELKESNQRVRPPSRSRGFGKALE